MIPSTYNTIFPEPDLQVSWMVDSPENVGIMKFPNGMGMPINQSESG